MVHKIFGDATQKLLLRGFVLNDGNSAQGRQSRTPLEWRAQRCKAITKKNYWAKLVSGGRVVGGRGRGVRGGYLWGQFVGVADRRHTGAPVVVLCFEIIEWTSIMKRNVLYSTPTPSFLPSMSLWVTLSAQSSAWVRISKHKGQAYWWRILFTAASVWKKPS